LRDSINICMNEYPHLTKEKILEIGRDHDIELDSNLTVTGMVEQLSEHLKAE